MDAILSFVNQPQVQFALTLAGGWILKRWPAFNNKAIPLATLSMNLAISLLGPMFGVVPAHAEVAGVVTASGAPTLNPLFDALITWVAATGTHGGFKNLWQWVRGGFRFTA